jgi:hypothetical protein
LRDESEKTALPAKKATFEFCKKKGDWANVWLVQLVAESGSSILVVESSKVNLLTAILNEFSDEEL